MKMLRLILCAILPAAAGCASITGGDTVSKETSAEFARAEQLAAESLTLSRLRALERSLSDFERAEGKVPSNLDALIPKYLAEIPEAVLAVRDHKDSNSVRNYPSGVISNGMINGAKLRDRGGWGYAFNSGRAIIFVNCTHATRGGQPWYRMGTGIGR
ncbi:MAG: hypothetical protein ABIJ96_07555 [Elusimicrobiota bacterium]